MAMPMQKHPIKLTSIIPVGNVKKYKFFIRSLMMYLRGAPKAPPHAIKKNFVINGDLNRIEYLQEQAEILEEESGGEDDWGDDDW